MVVSPNLDTIHIHELMPVDCTYIDHLPTTEFRHENHHLEQDTRYLNQYNPRYSLFIGGTRGVIADIIYDHKYNKEIPLCDESLDPNIPDDEKFIFAKQYTPLRAASYYWTKPSEICTYSGAPFSPFYWIRSYSINANGVCSIVKDATTVNNWNNSFPPGEAYGFYITPLYHPPAYVPDVLGGALEHWWPTWFASSQWKVEGITNSRGGDAINGGDFHVYSNLDWLEGFGFAVPPVCTIGYPPGGLPTWDSAYEFDVGGLYKCTYKWESGLVGKVRATTPTNFWIVAGDDYFETTGYHYHEDFLAPPIRLNPIEGMPSYQGSGPQIWDRDLYWPFQPCGE